MRIFRDYKNVLMVILLLVIGGAGHIVLYGIDVADSICQIYYGICVLIWAMTVRDRIIDRRARGILIGIAGLLLAAFLIQLVRYKFIYESATALKYLWYSYYVVLESVPFLTFVLSVLINIPEEEKVDKGYFFVGVPSAVLIALIYTNDLHNLVFITTDDTAGATGSYGHGSLFYVCYAWIYVLFAISLTMVFSKCALYSAKRKIWIPVVLMMSGFVLLIMNIFDVPKLSGITVWSFIEEYAYVVIALTEASICVGLIPANTGYKKMFGLSDRMIKITDTSGNTLYASRNGEKAFEENEDTRIFQKEIRGGYVSWAVDISKLNELNRNIAEVTDRIETRNEFLKNDIAIKEERSKLDTRNNLYDSISHLVRPQLEKIQQLIDAISDENFDESIAKIAVLNAYIKRRSNMELIETDDGKLPSEELYTAVFESVGYISLCKLNAAVTPTKSFRLSKEIMTMAYSVFETVVEHNIYIAKNLLVTTSRISDTFTLRLSLDKDAKFDKTWIESDEFFALGGKIVSNFEDGLNIAVSFREGGDV